MTVPRPLDEEIAALEAWCDTASKSEDLKQIVEAGMAARVALRALASRARWWRDGTWFTASNVIKAVNDQLERTTRKR